MRTVLGACVIALVGCSSQASPTGTEVSPVIGGQLATAYPEAVLITTDHFRCSGAVIAPYAVLTAGHCARNASYWDVTAPYAGGQAVRATKKWTEYYSTTGGVDGRAMDLALILLPTPITLDFYPRLATAPLHQGSKVVNVGRVQDGHVSDTDLFFGAPVTVMPGDSWDYPHDYVADLLIQAGDSGGPVYYMPTPEEGGGSRVLVAVNSANVEGGEALYRVDEQITKLHAVIADWTPEAASH